MCSQITNFLQKAEFIHITDTGLAYTATATTACLLCVRSFLGSENISILLIWRVKSTGLVLSTCQLLWLLMRINSFTCLLIIHTSSFGVCSFPLPIFLLCIHVFCLTCILVLYGMRPLTLSAIYLQFISLLFRCR